MRTSMSLAAMAPMSQPIQRALRGLLWLPLLAPTICAQEGSEPTASAPARPAASATLRWERTLEEARIQAKRAGTFVFVSLPVDRPGHGRGQLRGSLWDDAELRETLAAGFCVAGSHHRHVEVESGLDAKGQELPRICTRFGQLVCDQHREIEKQVLARYFGGEEPAARPVFLVISPSDGALLARQVGETTPQILADIVRSAARAIDGDGLPTVPSELLGRATSENAAIRFDALRALAALTFPAADGMRRQFVEGAPNDAVRAEIFAAMFEAGNGSLFELARKALDSKEPILRTQAGRALAADGRPNAAEPILKRLAQPIAESERWIHLLSLGRVARGHGDAIAVLRRDATSSRPLIRSSALMALASAAPADEKSIMLFEQRMASDLDARVRGTAAVARVLAEPDAGGEESPLAEMLRKRSRAEKDQRVVDVLTACASFVGGNLEIDMRRPLVALWESTAR